MRNNTEVLLFRLAEGAVEHLFEEEQVGVDFFYNWLKIGDVHHILAT